jgi:hypothetical protein
MKKRNVVGCLLVWVAGLAAGCASTESTDVRTSGVYVNYLAENSGSSTKVSAVLRVGEATSNTFLQLVSGEKVVVSSEGQSQTLTEVNLLSAYSYVGTFTSAAENVEYVFNFDRAEDTDDAPNSRARIPSAFTLSAPTAPTISRASPITVAWAPSGTTDKMTVEVSGDCINTRVYSVTADPGTFTINAGDVQPRVNGSSEACSAKVAVRRSRAGTLDPAFTSGGTITGVQLREASFRSDP